LGNRNSIDHLYESWTKTISRYCEEHKDRLRPAKDQYSSEQWKASLLLAERAGEHFQIEHWVISAGLGLIHADRLVPGYRATFSDTTDRIYDVEYFSRFDARLVHRGWWSRLTGAPLLTTTLQKPVSLSALANSLGKGDSMLVVGSTNYVDAVYDDLARVERIQGNLRIVGFPEGRDMLPPNVAKMGSGYRNHSKYVESLYNLYGQVFAEVGPSIVDPKVRGRFGHVMAGYHALMRYLESGDWHVKFD
jgi:hypothetical protein